MSLIGDDFWNDWFYDGLSLRRNKDKLNTQYYPLLWPTVTTSTGQKLSESLVTSDKDVVLTLVMPGVAKEDLKIDIVERVLNIVASSKVESALIEKTILKSYSIPVAIDMSAVTAKLENGILTVTMPRVLPKVESVVVPIS